MSTPYGGRQLCFCSSFVLLLLSSSAATDDDEPTAADLAELYGSAVVDGNPSGAKRLGAFVAGSFTPLSGYAFGPGRNNVALATDNKVINADPNTNGAVFVPSSGYRHPDTGAVSWIGSWGGSWSSTASTSANAHYLGFTSTTIIPQESSYRSFGFPVRCIRD